MCFIGRFPAVPSQVKDENLVSQCVVLDMGYWEWTRFAGPGMAAEEAVAAAAAGEVMDDVPWLGEAFASASASASRVVHLMQVVSSSVAPRVMLFPWPFEGGDSWDKVRLGFFDAPGKNSPLSRVPPDFPLHQSCFLELVRHLG
jgi:hypothetical protein